MKLLVVGGGTMGSGIAQSAAGAAIPTTLQDVSAEVLSKARIKIEKHLGDKTKFLSFTTELTPADFVIEAVPEDLKLKSDVFLKLNKICPNKAIFASNTSSLSISEMAEASGRPEQFIGMHFFNPVHKMKLVEIVTGKKTDEKTLAATIDLAHKMGKETVKIKESPGFVTSRMNALIGNEAFRMLEAGIASAEDIDKALKLGLNHPMGPFELVDLVGLDVRLAILRYLEKTLGGLYKPSPLLEKFVQEGRLGRKAGKGVYDYGDRPA